jgi:phosphatidylserine synthase
MARKLWLTLSNLLTVSLLGLCLYYAILQNAIWAKNLVTFYIWFCFIIFLIATTIPNKTFQDKYYKSYFPYPLVVIINVAVIIVLVAKGWFGLGTLYTISVIISVAKHTKPPQKKSDFQTKKENKIQDAEYKDISNKRNAKDEW